MPVVVPVNAAGFAFAASELLNGEVVAYPTETVYGLGVNPRDEAAVSRLFELKGRGSGSSVLMIVAEPADVEAIASVSESARACMDSFWPGPLTLVLPTFASFPSGVQGPDGTIAVRCPSSVAARNLAQAFGGPITSTSANRTGGPPARTPADASLEGVACVLDGGELPPSEPSTVFAPDLDVVYREGAVPVAELRRLGYEARLAQS